MRSLDVKRTLGDLADDRNVMSASLSLYTTHNCTNCTDCLRSGHARMGVDVKSQSAKREQMRTQKLAFQGKCLRRDKYEHIGARRNGLLPRYVAPTDTHERARVNSQHQASRQRRRRTQTSTGAERTCLALAAAQTKTGGQARPSKYRPLPPPWSVSRLKTHAQSHKYYYVTPGSARLPHVPWGLAVCVCPPRLPRKIL